jgi:DoxX
VEELWLAPGLHRAGDRHPAFPLVAGFLKSIVLPNLAVFGMITFVVEIALGVALVLGLLTRLAGIAGPDRLGGTRWIDTPRARVSPKLATVPAAAPEH